MPVKAMDMQVLLLLSHPSATEPKVACARLLYECGDLLNTIGTKPSVWLNSSQPERGSLTLLVAALSRLFGLRPSRLY